MPACVTDESASSALLPKNPPTKACLREAEEWLQAPTKLDPRFKPALEASFVADKEAIRLNALRISNAAGCVASVAILPVVWTLLPDARQALFYQFACGVIPMAFGFAILVRTSLSLATKEWLQVFLAVVMGAVIGNVLKTSRYSPDSYLFASLILLGILSAVGARLSFRATRVLIVGLTVVFESIIWQLPDVTMKSGIGLAILWVFTAFFVLYGNWQYETEQRRSYGLGLLAASAGHDLALANGELAALAGRDALTGLANRRSYDAWMLLHWGRAADTGNAVGLVVIDIDFFKQYNDHYGHAAGDACLRSVAGALRDSLRGTTDYVARLGGEEFVALLLGPAVANIGEVAERLRASVAALELPHAGSGPGKTVTVSCGAAGGAVTEGVLPASLFEAADAALYQAKRTGRNRVCLAMQDAGIEVMAVN